jgi:hypothetical protein
MTQAPPLHTNQPPHDACADGDARLRVVVSLDVEE